MKFAIVALIVALAVGAQCFVERLDLDDGQYRPKLYLDTEKFYDDGLYRPYLYNRGYYGAAFYDNRLGPIAVHATPAIAAPHVVSAPVFAPAIIPGEGRYVAENRGSLHTAPLPGHIDSVSSVNVEPAPGTI